MAFTSHGHHIEGTTPYCPDPEMKIARCGGPGLCNVCSREAASALTNHMSKQDLEVLNDMRPDLLRQWLIEKMLENGAIKEFNNIDQIIVWADVFETYIKSGKKAESGD